MVQVELDRKKEGSKMQLELATDLIDRGDRFVEIIKKVDFDIECGMTMVGDAG